MLMPAVCCRPARISASTVPLPLPALISAQEADSISSIVGVLPVSELAAAGAMNTVTLEDEFAAGLSGPESCCGFCMVAARLLP